MGNDKGFKCKDCPNCPYYESPTSYGAERIKCANTDCIQYGADYMRADNEEE